MGERREVARCADRSLRRNERNQAGVVNGEKRIDHRLANARVAARETRRLEAEDQPDDRRGERVADADAVRADQVELQLRQVGAVDARAGELAEAGVDAVDRRIAGRGALHDGGAGADALARCGVDPQRRAAAVQSLQVVERQRTADEIHRGSAAHSASSSISSPARCAWLPAPGDAKLSAAGLLLRERRAVPSASSPARPAFTTSTFSTVASIVDGREVGRLVGQVREQRSGSPRRCRPARCRSCSRRARPWRSASTPMLPAAPTLFSTTKGWPSASASSWPEHARRARRPGRRARKARSTWTGLDGIGLRSGDERHGGSGTGRAGRALHSIRVPRRGDGRSVGDGEDAS